MVESLSAPRYLLGNELLLHLYIVVPELSVSCGSNATVVAGETVELQRATNYHAS